MTSLQTSDAQGTSRHRAATAWGSAVMIALLAACSADADSEDDVDGASEEQGAEGGVFTDAAGDEVEVPADVEDVVVLHYAGTQALVDLDVTPVGQGSLPGPASVPDDVWEVVEDIPEVTEGGAEPQLEQIAGLAPDLILAPNVIDDDVLGQLQDVAPVYQFTLRGENRGEWTYNVEEIAEILDRTERYEQLESEFEARVEEVATDYAEVIEGLDATVVASFEEGNPYLNGSDSMTGNLLGDLGFGWSASTDAALEDEDEPEGYISLEDLSEAAGDADVVFFDSDFEGTPSALTGELTESEAYERLPAVEDGHDYPFGKITIAGFSDAHASLDLIVEALEDLDG